MQVPVVTRTSQATRPIGSSVRTASRTASEIWSAILSGCPSVTDSEVNRNFSSACGKKVPSGGVKSTCGAVSSYQTKPTNNDGNMRVWECQSDAGKWVKARVNGDLRGLKARPDGA